MFRASENGAGWFVETDEAAPLAYLRGLPESGSGQPFSTARNGSKTGGNANPETMLIAAGFDKQTATAFATDFEGYLRALKLSTDWAAAGGHHREAARRF